jgi:hypothetical protein
MAMLTGPLPTLMGLPAVLAAVRIGVTVPGPYGHRQGGQADPLVDWFSP